MPSAETPITEIALAGALAEAKAELSGMAWYGDTLIFLPQYPFLVEKAAFFTLCPSPTFWLIWMAAPRGH
ncbi:MAG: hypothetical protein M5U34_02815 [Chloroflexi bacterium]|nr:hypothetical protein [Chloroflexota bacterium]